MPIRTILVPALPGDQLERRLDAVLPLARRMEAHLDVLLLLPDPAETLAFTASGFIPPGPTVDMLREEGRNYAAETEDMLRAWRKRNDVPSEFQKHSLRTTCATFTKKIGGPDRMIAQAGRLADLIVLDRPVETVGWSTAVSDAAIFDTGRPVLLVPPGLPPSVPMLGRVVIAWNGSLQATRAVVGAMPLMHEADEVMVIASETDPASPRGSAPEESHENGGASLCRALEFHGIRASRCGLERGESQTVGEALLRQAHRQEATMLVMGAFTHSRLRQFLLGGVTKYMFDHADLPLLVAH